MDLNYLGIPADLPTEIVIGKFLWIDYDSQYDSPLGIHIAILLDNEPKPPRKNGLKPLRSIRLMGEAQRFFNNNTHLIKKGQEICLEVVTNNFEEAILAGKGLFKQGEFVAMRMIV